MTHFIFVWRHLKKKQLREIKFAIVACSQFPLVLHPKNYLVLFCYTEEETRE